MKKTILLILLAAICGTFTLVNTACAQGTAFTYEGQLNNGGAPANGTYDLTFSLYNANTGGTQTAGTVTNTAVGVTNGLFTVTMDFGAVFTGTPYWLQIGVRTSGNGAFTSLTPRQQLTPTPYALYAESSGSSSLVSELGTQSFFAGQNAGNPASPGNYNTGIGYAALDVNISSYNSALGNEALSANTTGDANTANGVFTLYKNTTGGDNTALGADAMANNISGSFNTAVGLFALAANTTGSNNTAFGSQAMRNSTDNDEVAVGYEALENDDAGGDFFGSGGNTAVGYEALQSDTTGAGNTALGWLALGQNLGAGNNTAVGWVALGNNTIGANNTATGLDALSANTSGSDNTATGVSALSYNQNGSNNTAFGYGALGNNTSDSFNTAFGSLSLYSDTTGGHNNTANGYQALYASTVGRANTATGIDAFQNLSSGDNNTAVGGFAFQNVTTGTGNIGLGENAGNTLTLGNNNIYIGNSGNSSESGIIRIGTPGTQTLTYIAGTIENPSCNNLTITGGSDLAEPFEVTSASREIPQGSVVVIDEENPGRLKVSSQPYDTHVAGVLSGANGINPGIQMHQEGMLEGGKNVALSGRVFVQADTSNGVIKPGDLLTTSSSPGRAMRVSDHSKAQGAILGKAMTGLKDGQGVVLVLVTLQ